MKYMLVRNWSGLGMNIYLTLESKVYCYPGL